MREKTRIVTSGRRPHANFGIVNPPVYHASTVLFPTVEALENRKKLPPHAVTYGLKGTPTQFSLAEALAELEGGHDTWLFPSGLAAIAIALVAYLKAGDHLLMVDSVYGPTRDFCDDHLRRFGVSTTYYDPAMGAQIASAMQPNTRVVFTESPGSLTFEVQDVPAIAKVARAHNALVLMDNTWATPLFFKPFEHGVDVSIQAVTKYLGGHSDVMMGAVTTTRAAWPALYAASLLFGQQASPDDCYLVQRGLRTLAVRLARHQENGLILARWLQEQPEVQDLLHPGLPGDAGHALWQRDFSGACGLFGVVLKPCPPEAVAAMLNGMQLFGMGFSWGGYESLILPGDAGMVRTASSPPAGGPLLRLHAGLEDAQDLIDDLQAGFQRLREAAQA